MPGACFLLASSPKPCAATDLDPLVLQLKWYHQFQFAGYYAADIEGYFEEEGLDVDIREGNPNRPPLFSVVHGSADFGVTDCDVLLARMKGRPVVACASVFQHSPYIFLTRADSGIRIPSDLVDRKIMVSGHQGSAQLLAMMRREGLPIDRLKIIPHTWSVADLISGKVDVMSAYATAEPSQVRAHGVAPYSIRASDYGIDFYGDTLFTTEDYVRKFPDRVDAMVRATTRGWAYAMDNPERMIDHILNMPGVKERGIRKENLEFEAREMRQLILPDLVEIGHMNPGRWKQTAEIFIDSGVAYEPSDPNWFDGFVYEPPGGGSLSLRVVGIVVAGLGLTALAVMGWSMTLRRQVEEKTREVRLGERKLNALLDNSANLQCLLSAQGCLAEVNRTALVFAGCERDEVLGKVFCETPWWAHSPSQSRKICDGIRRIREGGKEIRFETRHRDASGRERILDFSLRPVTRTGGRLEFIVAEGIDITAQKQAAEDLREVAELKRIILDTALDAVIGVDQEGNIVQWNKRASEIFGIDKADALGSPVRRHLTRLDEYLIDPDSECQGLRFEMNALRADGGVFPADLAVSILPRASRVALNIILRDITEQRKLEEKLRQSQKMQAIGQLAGGVAHDFNNLLTVIRGNATLLRDRAEQEDSLETPVTEILSASERASGLTRQLLAFSRRQPMKPRLLHVNESVSAVGLMLQRLIGEDIRLETDLHGGEASITADPVMMEQVLLNLAVNGRDAMPQGGTLRIATRRLKLSRSSSELPLEMEPGDFVRIDVEDTGTGIAPEHLPHIFEPFFSTKDVGKGTGLGLATVFGIVQQHGGWVAVDSTPGTGTLFSVWLPAAAASSSESTPANPEPDRGEYRGGGTETILLVEDEKMVRMIARKILAMHGYEVIEAGNGREAIEIWKEHCSRIDLLLTDIVMPEGISGHDLAVRLQGERPDLKVIYTSGYTAEIFRGDAVFPEDATFIGKPYEPKEMLRKLRHALDNELALTA